MLASPVVLVAASPANAATDRTGDARVAFVLESSGDLITLLLEDNGGVVSALARHFPPDWDFIPGDRLVVHTDVDGTKVVGPLVQTITSERFVVHSSTVEFDTVTVPVTSAVVREGVVEMAVSRGSQVHGLVITNRRSGDQRLFGLLDHPDHANHRAG